MATTTPPRWCKRKAKDPRNGDHPRDPYERFIIYRPKPPNPVLYPRTQVQDPLDRYDIPDLLANLVERSMVVVDTETGVYHLTESMRAYASGHFSEATPARRGGTLSIIRRWRRGCLS